MLMRPHDGAVDEDVLEVGIIAQRRKKPFPDPIAAPAVEPLIHRVPAPELLRQNAPMRSRRSEEHTSELQSLMRISYAVFCLKKKTKQHNTYISTNPTQHKYQSQTNNYQNKDN